MNCNIRYITTPTGVLVSIKLLINFIENFELRRESVNQNSYKKIDFEKGS